MVSGEKWAFLMRDAPSPEEASEGGVRRLVA